MIHKFLKALACLTIAVAFFFPHQPGAVAEAPVEQQKQQMTVEQMVTHYATEFGVSQELAHYIADNESRYDPKAVGDKYITCPNKRSKYYGQPVYARGVYQLTRCYYPDIKDEDAFDAEKNIKIAMQQIAKGKSNCQNQFSTCRDYYND